MDKNIQNRSKELFDESQAKQAKFVKKIILSTFISIGLVFAILGIIFIILSDLYKDVGVIFLPIGIFLIVLGIILYFIIPTKYNYEKYQARTQKYGMIDIYSMNAKIAELEARIEELEKNK